MWTLGADSPAQHPKISAAERYYIEESIGHVGQDNKVITIISQIKVFNT